MKRIRISTLMLLVVIAALVIAIAIQGYWAARREAAMRRYATIMDSAQPPAPAKP